MQQSLPDVSRENKQEISLYGQGKVSTKVLANCFIDLKKTFPKLPDGWYDILEKMLDEEKFTDKRLIDATNNLIKTCIYPEPTIANILGYDKKQKLYSYEDILEITKDYSAYQRGLFWDSLEKYGNFWIKKGELK